MESLAKLLEVKVNKSVYIAKSKQQYDKTLKNFLLHLPNHDLRYYATFKVRTFESLFYKTYTCLQKSTSCIGLQAKQKFSVNI